MAINPVSSHLNVRSDLSEELQYNLPGFPVRTEESLLSVFEQYAAECHWHNDFEFLWVEEGTIRYYVNGKNVFIPAGTGIFVNSGRLHFGYSSERQECRFRFVVIDPELLSENTHILFGLIQPLKKAEDFLLLRPESEGEILHSLYAIFDGMQDRRPGFELDVLGYFSALTASLFRTIRPQKPVFGERDQTAVKEMLSYVEQHLDEKLTLHEIALAGAVCESKCCRLFNLFTGRSPVRYVQQMRINRSMRLLSETEKSVTDIALECGFCSSSYFVETFRQLTGTTPRAYRSKASSSP